MLKILYSQHTHTHTQTHRWREFRFRILWVGFLGLLLSACEINSGETSSELELAQLEQRTQVIDYLDNLALQVESGDAILALNQEIDWNSLGHPDL